MRIDNFPTYTKDAPAKIDAVMAIITDERLRLAVNRHITEGNETWTHGAAVKVFTRDGYPAVRYEDGEWWHYETERLGWY